MPGIASKPLCSHKTQGGGRVCSITALHHQMAKAYLGRHVGLDFHCGNVQFARSLRPETLNPPLTTPDARYINKVLEVKPSFETRGAGGAGGQDLESFGWSKPMGSHFGVGEFTTHFRTYFSGDWDVHWGYALWTHGHVCVTGKSSCPWCVVWIGGVGKRNPCVLQRANGSPSFTTKPPINPRPPKKGKPRA